MKNILVLSDTHGNLKIFDKIMPSLVESDYIFHLGDLSSDAEYLRARFGDKVVSVAGNCDGNINGDTKTIEVEGVKFLLTHGHEYGVKSDLNRLYLEGISRSSDFCLYGHTHEARIDKIGDITLINPGTASLFASIRTYCYMTAVEGKCFYKIVEII